jgi:hypothetical protein
MKISLKYVFSSVILFLTLIFFSLTAISCDSIYVFLLSSGYGDNGKYGKCDLKYLKSEIINNYNISNVSLKKGDYLDYQLSFEVHKKHKINFTVNFFNSDQISKQWMMDILSESVDFEHYYPGTYTGYKIGEESLYYVPNRDRSQNMISIRSRYKNIHLTGTIYVLWENKELPFNENYILNKAVVYELETEMENLLNMINKLCN